MRNRKIYGLLVTIALILSLLPVNCRKNTGPALGKFRIISEIESNKDSPIYIDFANYPAERRSLPVGVFDSGTGGLTVLNSILTLDHHNNKTGQTGEDGIPDLKSEYFIYLGDQANMPYGRYDGEGKSDFLRELIIKDVQFLLDRKYYRAPTDSMPENNKKPVKAIVIACNTATAFGYELVRKAMKKWGLNIEILGIIEAGSEAAVAAMPLDGKGHTFGVMATEGTCASQGYPKSIKKQYLKKFRHDNIPVVQQAGFGLAAAVDGNIDYIHESAKEVRGREKYRGPGLDHPAYPVDLDLWEAYNFESGSGLLLKKDDAGKIIEVELNSVLNYTRYHVTHLVVKAAKEFPEHRLSTVILGCTHYPFFTKEIAEHFQYLRQLKEEYRRIIPGTVTLIDPAQSLALELYDYLLRANLYAIEKEDKETSRFYISAANPQLPGNKIDHDGGFPYDYKYGRSINSGLQYVKRVPFSRPWIKSEVLSRIKLKMPQIYNMIFKEDDQ